MTSPRPRSEDLEAALGRQIRELRAEKRLTQVELAELANVSIGALKHLEAGSGATIRTLMRVLRAMGQEGWVETLGPPAAAFNPLDVLDARRRDEQRPARRRVRRHSGAT